MAEVDSSPATPDITLEVDDEAEPEFSFLEPVKEAEPCLNFRLDPSASFGTCKCGHLKAAHGVQKENNAAKMLNKLKQKNSAIGQEQIETKSDRACNKFRLDVAAGFGMCKCGFKKTDHEEKRQNKASVALQHLKESNLEKYSEMVKNLETDGPCDSYRVDTAAAEFGVCHCGFRREDHEQKKENAAALMLKTLKDKNKKKHEMNDKIAIEGPVAEIAVPEETEKSDGDDVNQLDKEEAAAAEEKPKKKKKKGKKRCVIS